MLTWQLCLTLAALANAVTAQDLYCGEKNCYDVLGMNRDSSKAEIGKAYRKLAGKMHPDRFQGEAKKAEAEKSFMQIAAA